MVLYFDFKRFYYFILFQLYYFIFICLIYFQLYFDHYWTQFVRILIFSRYCYLFLYRELFLYLFMSIFLILMALLYLAYDYCQLSMFSRPFLFFNSLITVFVYYRLISFYKNHLLFDVDLLWQIYFFIIKSCC